MIIKDKQKIKNNFIREVLLNRLTQYINAYKERLSVQCVYINNPKDYDNVVQMAAYIHVKENGKINYMEFMKTPNSTLVKLIDAFETNSVHCVKFTKGSNNKIFLKDVIEIDKTKFV
jgi:hypothetical protein